MSEAERQVPTNNLAVFGFCELCGLIFGLPPGDDLYRGAPMTARMMAFLAIGGAFAILGPTWPALKSRFPRRLSATFVRTASDFRWWLIVVLFGLIGPVLIGRFVQPSPNQVIGYVSDIDTGEVVSGLAKSEPQKQGQSISHWLKLDDTRRWQFSKALKDATINSQGRVTCAATVEIAPDGPAALGMWAELQPLLYYSGWELGGSGFASRRYFAPGLTILTASDHGDPFVCGARLAELLQNMKVVSTTMRTNQVTPELIACKNNCIEIDVGAPDVR